MTKDIVVGDELPDWVGAKEFYQKYDPKEVIGRWVYIRLQWELGTFCVSLRHQGACQSVSI